MGVVAAALKELVAAGVTGEALVQAIERIEAAVEVVRSPAAERTARWRERLAMPATDWARLRQGVLERDAFTCRYCGSQVEPLHCDHIVPLIQGGTNDADNLATACASCNREKSGRSPEQWRTA